MAKTEKQLAISIDEFVCAMRIAGNDDRYIIDAVVLAFKESANTGTCVVKIMDEHFLIKR